MYKVLTKYKIDGRCVYHLFIILKEYKLLEVKKMKKRILVLIATLFLFVSFIGCTNYKEISFFKNTNKIEEKLVEKKQVIEKKKRKSYNWKRNSRGANNFKFKFNCCGRHNVPLTSV